jgi:hypothetical protein
MVIDLLYRTQKAFEPEISIEFFNRNQERDFQARRNAIALQVYGHYVLLDSYAPYNYHDRVGFIIYRDYTNVRKT